MKAKDLAYLTNKFSTFAPVSIGVLIGSNETDKGSLIYDILEVPLPPDQKKPFTDVQSMISTRYDKFDYKDFLVEFID